MINEFLSTIYLFVALFLPGISVLLIMQARINNLEQLIIYSFSVSAAYLMVVNLILLRFDIFNMYSVASIIFIPAIAAAFVSSFKQSAGAFISNIRIENYMFLLVIILVFSSLILFTPKWNFLISPNMDAGNYEVYGNHFWKSGSLYFHLSPYLEKNIPVDWLRSRNTWVFTAGSDYAIPNYLYGYPVLLGLVKLIYGSPYVSWIVNGVFSVLSAILMGALLLRLTKNRVLSFFVLLSLCFTPIFYYYSKQIMSEQVALFGFILICYCILDYGVEKEAKNILGIISGLTLLLLVKLDAYMIPALLMIALSVVWIECMQKNNRIWPKPIVLILLGFAVSINALIVIWLCNPGYLSHFSIKPISKYGPTVFLYMYIIAMLIGYAALSYAYVYKSAKISNFFSSINLSLLISSLIAIIWLYFIGWNFSTRPVGVSLADNHDAFNLYRLMTVFNPLFLIVSLLVFPFVIIRANPYYKIILLVGLSGLGMLIFKSGHSSPDVWWMRRYLVLLLPVTAIIIGLLYRQIIINHWVKQTTAFTVTTCVALISIAIQYPKMDVLLDYEVNAMTPKHMTILEEYIEDDSLLITTEVNHVVRGTINTFRSLRNGPTILNVPEDKVGYTIGLYPDINAIALVTQKKLTDEPFHGYRFVLKSEGLFKKQWINDLGLLLRQPDFAKYSQYYLYVTSRKNK